MEEIRILAVGLDDAAGAARFRVFEGPEQAAQPLPGHDAVVVRKGDELTGGSLYAAVPCVRYADAILF